MLPKTKRRIVIGYYGYTQEERTPRVLSGILQYQRELGDIELRLFLIDVHRTFTNDEVPPWTGQVDGILVGTAIVGDDAIEWVKTGGVPSVTLVSNVVDPRLPLAIVDPASIAQLAVLELLRCRCRRLLFVGFRPSAGSALRGKALEQAAAVHGLPFARVDSEWTFSEAGEEDPSENLALARLLKAKPRPVGVHALNDAIGRRVLRICRELGLRVPEDVALVTADDTPLAFESRPTLTSVRFPGEQLGYRAAQLLAGIIAGGRPPRRPAFVAARETVIRETTGGAPEPDDVIRAMEIIRRKATLGLKVEDLSRTLSVNRRTLERAFRERLERSPAVEIQRLRMAAARELLRNSEFSISQVAVLAGYAETAAFSTAFRRETGFTPTEYRCQPKLGNDSK